MREIGFHVEYVFLTDFRFTLALVSALYLDLNRLNKNYKLISILGVDSLFYLIYVLYGEQWALNSIE